MSVEINLDLAGAAEFKQAITRFDAEMQEWNTEVGAEAAYAANIEFGSRYTMAKPFLNPAVQAHLPELERVLVEALNLAKVEAEL
jgi:hypothetical protein